MVTIRKKRFEYGERMILTVVTTKKGYHFEGLFCGHYRYFNR